MLTNSLMLLFFFLSTHRYAIACDLTNNSAIERLRRYNISLLISIEPRFTPLNHCIKQEYICVVLQNQEYRRFKGEEHSYLAFTQLFLRYQLDLYVVVLVTRFQLLYILFRFNVLITSSKFSSCMFVFSNATCWSHWWLWYLCYL